MILVRSAALLLSTMVGFAAAAAQNVERIEISDPEALFPEPFSSVNGLRELSDGRLIVSDRTERVVRVVDMTTGDSRVVGRSGDGPGEYRMPGTLLPMPGDSTMLSDIRNMRMSVIDPDGSITRSIPLLRSDGAFKHPTAADAEGGLYFTSSVVISREAGRAAPPDSVAVVRWDPLSDVLDTICFVRRENIASAGTIRLGGGGVASVSGVQHRPFAPRDAWAVAPDGRVSVAYASDYHIEWVGRDGNRVVGPPTDYRPVRITRAEKEDWAERQAGSSAVRITTSSSGGGRSTMTVPRPDIDEIEWPDEKPPFASDGLRMSPEGELWVGLHMRAGEAQAFDVFDSSGHRVRTVVLPEGRRFVGFGDGVLYTIYADADDLKWLERYAR